MTNVAILLLRPGNDWHAYCPSLSAKEMADAWSIIGRTMPGSLIELFELCNGGEGSLPFQPWNFMLWSLEEVVQIFEDAHYRKYFPGYVFFGSNGGGEYFGLDADGCVFFMDPIAGEQSVVVVATTFDEFIAHVGTSPPTGWDAPA